MLDVLACLDLNAPSQGRALFERAVAMLEGRPLTLSLAYMYEDISVYLRDPSLMARWQQDQREREQAAAATLRGYLAELTPPAAPGRTHVGAHTDIAAGLHEVSKGRDLVVVGYRAPAGMRVFGSALPQRLVRRCNVPVLVVPLRPGD